MADALTPGTNSPDARTPAPDVHPAAPSGTTLYKTYLDSLRSAIVWKLEGLPEWKLRWPVTGTGTNLLGVVKHLAAMEYGYLSWAFGKCPEPLDWIGPQAEPNADLWASADESVEDVLRLYRRAVASSDETLASHEPSTPAHVPWWPEPDVTLERVALHLCVEVARHAGHIDIVRETLDGRIGSTPKRSNLPFSDEHLWESHVDRLREIAVQAQWPGATLGLYAFPGPTRDKLIAPILSGEKTRATSLLRAYRASGEALPEVGQREVVLDSAGLPVAITRTTDVQITRLDEVGLDHVLGEGEGFVDVGHWRAAHEQFWASAPSRAELDDPNFTLDDSTQVVLQRFEVVERLR